MSLTHVKSAIRIRIFTFYLLKAEQYTSRSGTERWMCLLLLLLVIPGNQGWLW